MSTNTSSQARVGLWSDISWDAESLAFADPYFVWMDVSGRLSRTEEELPVLVEMVETQTVDQINADQTKANGLHRLHGADAATALRYGTAHATKRFFNDPSSFGVSRYVLGVPRMPIKTSVPLIPVLTEQSAQPVMIVIDDGLPFLHPSYHDNSVTRVVSMQFVADANRNLSQSKISQMLAEPERAAYASLHYDRVLSGASHGAHIMDVAAGKGRNDAADHALIFAVQLPVDTLTDSSGGGLAVHALDALTFALANVHAKSPVVACLSYGIHAGPHDGSSVLECALDELLLARGKTDLILPAGNNRQSNGHACFVATDQAHRLFWNILPADRTDSFCEIWSDPVETNHAPPRFTLIAPNGSRIECAGQSVSFLGDGSNLPAAALVVKKSKRGDGSYRWSALVCVRATQGMEPAEHGRWTIEVKTEGEQLIFDAWIERDGAVFGADSGGQQSFFDNTPASGVTEAGTLNGLATGHQVTVVAAKVKATHQVADYSALQSETVQTQKALMYEYVDENFSGEGVVANGPVSGEMMRMSGTSVAAAMYARRRYNELAKQTSAPNQI